VFAALIAATVVVAAADWWAVATERRKVEHVLKPLTMVVLIAAAASISAPDPAAARWWLVAGLAASLMGDVFLMLEGHFVEGLAAFLVGHLLYIVALATMGITPAALVGGVVLVAALVVVLGRRIVAGAAAADPRLRVPVTAYIAAISVMVAMAVGTLRPAAIVGALLFYASDACIGWSRFIDDFPRARVIIMVTYHLGQIGLVLSLLGTA
jgi:uncharacterized membrane protein YhhN